MVTSLPAIVQSPDDVIGNALRAVHKEFAEVVIESSSPSLPILSPREPNGVSLPCLTAPNFESADVVIVPVADVVDKASQAILPNTISITSVENGITIVDETQAQYTENSIAYTSDLTSDFDNVTRNDQQNLTQNENLSQKHTDYTVDEFESSPQDDSKVHHHETPVEALDYVEDFENDTKKEAAREYEEDFV
jgi:hypothetical protein